MARAGVWGYDVSAMTRPPPSSLPTRTARKPKGEGHVRRKEILEAAERIFVQQGYDGATIRKIADEVGLSSTALYMHFADKSEILYEICRNVFTTLKARQDEVIHRAEPFDLRMRGILQAYVAFGLGNPNAYRLVYMTRPGEAANGAQSASMDLGRDVLRDFENFVESGAAEGRLKTDPRIAAQTLWAGVHGVTSLLITKPYLDWAPPEALSGAMLDCLIGGLVRS